MNKTEKLKQERKEKRLQYTRDWRKRNKEHIKKYEKVYRENNRERVNENKRKYMRTEKGKARKKRDRVKNKEKYRSRNHANFHLNKSSNCLFCGGLDNLQFHHLIYRTPCQQKDVITVCKKCHTKIDRITKIINTETIKEVLEIIEEEYKYCMDGTNYDSRWNRFVRIKDRLKTRISQGSRIKLEEVKNGK